MSRRAAGLAAICGLAVLGYFYYSKNQLDIQREQRRNESVGKPLVGGPFNLVDHNGYAVTEKDFLGRYMLIYFGYTFCPDICPEELEKMSEIVTQIGMVDV
jgi:protein SCO1/2